MDSEKGLSGHKLSVAKNRVSEDELSPVVGALTQKIEQLDGIIRCLAEQQYDFGKKLKQIDALVGQGSGVIIDGEDTKLEHLNSLTKLAEKTLVEADKLAESMKQDIEEQAKAEAVKVIVMAEETAKAEAAKVIVKAEEEAKAEAERTIEEAKQRAKMAAAEEAQNILGGITEIRDVFEKAYQKVLTNLGDSQNEDSSGK